MTAPSLSTVASAQGVILFAHGSRDPLWRQPIEAVAARTALLAPDVPVRCAYLELTQPDLPTAAAELVALGVKQIRVLPLFLGTGRHAREDLPLLIAEIQASYPHISVSLQPPVGEHPQLLDLMAQLAVADLDTPLA